MPEDVQPHKMPDVGLPPRIFLYTIDQIATMLSVNEQTVSLGYIFYEGRTDGLPTRDEMIARNISPARAAPVWRVAENDLVRWFKRKGFIYHERGFVGR